MPQSILYKLSVPVVILVVILILALALVIFIALCRRPAKTEYYRLSPARDRKTGRHARLDNYSVENVKFETVTGQIKPAHLYREIFRQDSIGRRRQIKDKKIPIKGSSRSIASTSQAKEASIIPPLADRPEQAKQELAFILYKAKKENPKLSAVLHYINAKRLITAIRALNSAETPCIYCKIPLSAPTATNYKKTGYTEAYFVKPPEDNYSVITSLNAQILEKDGIIIIPCDQKPTERDLLTGYLIEDLFTAPEFNFRHFSRYFSGELVKENQAEWAAIKSYRILIPSSVKSSIPPYTVKELAYI